MGETPYSVFHGNLGGKKVIVKMAMDEDMSELKQEFSTTCRRLFKLQGSAIPKCHSMFVSDSSAFLLLKDRGSSISSFAYLTKSQK